MILFSIAAIVAALYFFISQPNISNDRYTLVITI